MHSLRFSIQQQIDGTTIRSWISVRFLPKFKITSSRLLNSRVSSIPNSRVSSFLFESIDFLNNLIWLIDWLIVGLLHPVFRGGCGRCWSLPPCSLPRWRSSHHSRLRRNQCLVTLNTSSWRGMDQFSPAWFLQSFMVLLLHFTRFSPLFFLLFAAKEGFFVVGLITVSGCLYWTLDWFGHSNRSKVCMHAFIRVFPLFTYNDFWMAPYFHPHLEKIRKEQRNEWCDR